jgi:hypothetical protein
MLNVRKHFLFLAVLGFELRVLHLLGRCSTTSATPPDLFIVLGIFKIGSLELFARIGFVNLHHPEQLGL